jgi:DnaJ-class molecular chaperone
MYQQVKKGESCKCPKCNGSGVYYGRGVVENGVFKGHTGKCYTCRGTGQQTFSDYKRCETYWNRYARIG